MVKYIDTEENSLRVLAATVRHDEYTVVNTRVILPIVIERGMRIVNIQAWKEVPFDVGVLKFGAGDASNARELWATGEEVAATEPGVSECHAWRIGGTNLLSQNKDWPVFARLEGGVPSVGIIHFWVTLFMVSPRPNAGLL